MRRRAGRHSSAAVLLGVLVLATPLPSALADDEPVTQPAVVVPSTEPTPPPAAAILPPPPPTATPTPEPTTDPAPAPDPVPAPEPAPAPPPEPTPEPSPPVEPDVATDPVTGFRIDPATGWPVHPPTGFLVEPGTNNLVLPGSYAYTTFRWDPLTGLVEDIAAEDVVPTEDPDPAPQATPTAIVSAPAPSAPPPASPTPPRHTSPTTSATADPSGGTTAVEGNTEQASDQRPVGEQPLTRILVILLLVGLGVLYYRRLRSAGKD